jgi:S-disulfanyl-L-cysteine oxidoreductase SoxD
MSTLSRIAVVAVAALSACATQTSSHKPPALGASVSAAEIARWDISIPPSGAGLPSGSGTARQGVQVYEQKCLVCHGAKGAGKPADPLAGGIGTLATRTPVRTVGSYWPYATTLFDYVRRAMPILNPLSLTNDEVYAVTAYMLNLSGIIGEDVPMNAQSLPQVKMPNRDGFVSDWPPRAR